MKRRDYELETLMLVCRCQGAARRKVPSIETWKRQLKHEAVPRHGIAPSIVIDGQAIELPQDAVRLVLLKVDSSLRNSWPGDSDLADFVAKRNLEKIPARQMTRE
jgi:hypothetical protein